MAEDMCKLHVEWQKFLKSLLEELRKIYGEYLPTGSNIGEEASSILDYNSFLGDCWKIIEKLEEFEELKKVLCDYAIKSDRVKIHLIKFVSEYLKRTEGSLQFNKDVSEEVYSDFKEYLNELKYMCITIVCGLSIDEPIILSLNENCKLFILDITDINTHSELKQYKDKILSTYIKIVSCTECSYLPNLLTVLLVKFPKQGDRRDMDMAECGDFCRNVLDCFLTSLRLLKRGSVHLTNVYCTPLSNWIARSFLYTSAPIPRTPLVTKDEFENQEYIYTFDISLRDKLEKLFKFLIENYNGLGKLKGAIRRFNASYEKEYLEDRLIDYAIIWDTLLYPEGSGEARTRIAERMAILIGNNHDDKQEIKELVKEIYKERSKIVHRDKKISWKKDKELRNVIQAEEYTRKLILRLIDIYEKSGKSIEDIIKEINEKILDITIDY